MSGPAGPQRPSGGRPLAERVRGTLSALAGPGTVVLDWPDRGEAATNWGDKLNPHLVALVSGRRVVSSGAVFAAARRDVHYVIGSHLGVACANPRAVVWGPGFISHGVKIASRPMRIHAVRGWLSVERLRREGIACPDVVGDPALLLPRFYRPRPAARRYGLGLVAHFRESGERIYEAARGWDDTLVIDICGGIETVVDQIAACDRIASSSLHGLICADAYGVANAWVSASRKPLGDGFKFHDYLSSVGRTQEAPVRLRPRTPRQAILDAIPPFEAKVDVEPLWRARPPALVARE